MSRYATSKKSSVLSRYPANKSILRTDELTDNFVVIPPDGGWGWWVVVASFLCSFVIDGIILTFGMFLDDISESLKVPPSKVAQASSVMGGFYYLLGPVTCALTNRFGFRVIGICGSLISASAFALSSTVNSLPMFLLLYGFIGGMGFNMVFAPSILVIGFYFERWRALATSIAVCGSSTGLVAFPILITQVFNKYNWRMKLRILGVLCGACSLFMLIYRPIKPVRITDDEKRVQFLEETDSIGSFQIDNNLSLRQIFKQFNNTMFPTKSDLTLDNSQKTGGSDSSTLVATLPQESSLSSVGTKNMLRSVGSKYDTVSEKLATVYEEDDEQEVHKQRGKLTICFNGCLRKCFTSYCTNPFSVGVTNRPMYRDDIFFTGSLYTLPQYSRSRSTLFSGGPSTKPSAMDYTLSVSRVATEKDLEENKRCTCCPIAVVRTLATMLDVSLLKSPSFALTTFSGFCTILGMHCPFLFIVQRALDMNLDESWSFYLLSIIGVSNTIGRIACGIISSFPKADALIICSVTMSICGVMTIFSNYLYSLEGQIIYAIIFGSTLASGSALKSIVLVDLVGLENLTNAFGITMLFHGIASFIGVPLAVLMVYQTGSNNASFLFSGMCILISALLLIPVKRLARWEKRQKENQQNNERKPGVLV